MPAYTSHSIFADELHDKLIDEGIDTDRKSLRVFSTIPDLIEGKLDNHNKNVQDYILFLIHYVKAHSLSGDRNVRSLLYGIISHYYFDTIAHPFIYSIDFSTKKTQLLSNHYLIEGYISYHLADRVLKSNIMLVRPEYSTMGSITPESKQLLDESYRKIYGASMIGSIRKKSQLIQSLEYAYKKIVKDNKILAQACGFNDYLRINSMTSANLDNRDHNEWTNPFTGEISTKSFDDLYTDALWGCVEAIDTVDKYLRGDVPSSALDTMFQNSYDTGTIYPIQKYREEVQKVKK